eukprot:2165372-Pyramimonas_sp.AAC.2
MSGHRLADRHLSRMLSTTGCCRGGSDGAGRRGPGGALWHCGMCATMGSDGRARVRARVCARVCSRAVSYTHLRAHETGAYR